jgi:hypothetical protein
MSHNGIGVTDDQIIEQWKKTPSAVACIRHFGYKSHRAFYKRLESLRNKGIRLGTSVPHSPYFDPNVRVSVSETIKHCEARIISNFDDGVLLVGSDAHYWPGQITTAHRAFVWLCKELNPASVILNGDIFDGAQVSRWPRIGWDERPTVLQELRACEERLTEIEDAAPHAKRYWPLGNHDARFENKLAYSSHEYEGVKGFCLKDHFPKWRPCWSVMVNETLLVKHRYKGGIHAPRNNTLNAGVSICTGHLHSQKVVPVTDEKGTRWGVDSGTMAEPKGPQFVDYTEDNTLDWRSGFAVFTFHKGRLLHPELVSVSGEDQIDFRGSVLTVP